MRIDIQEQKWNKSWFLGVSYNTFGVEHELIVGFWPYEMEFIWVW